MKPTAFGGAFRLFFPFILGMPPGAVLWAWKGSVAGGLIAALLLLACLGALCVAIALGWKAHELAVKEEPNAKLKAQLEASKEFLEILRTNLREAVAMGIDVGGTRSSDRDVQ
jgi:hypothetical protein